MSESDNNNEQYINLNNKIKNKRTAIYDLERSLQFLKSDLKEDIKQLQNICVHQYKRECTTSGCYAEYASICTHCRNWR